MRFRRCKRGEGGGEAMMLAEETFDVTFFGAAIEEQARLLESFSFIRKMTGDSDAAAWTWREMLTSKS